MAHGALPLMSLGQGLVADGLLGLLIMEASRNLAETLGGKSNRNRRVHRKRLLADGAGLVYILLKSTGVKPDP